MPINNKHSDLYFKTYEKTNMTPTELYELLDKHDVEYEIVEIFEGIRLIRVEVNDDQD